MTKKCVTIDIKAPAYIISTGMEISQTICIEPCRIQVTVEWQNAGDVSDIFIPSIRIDNGSIQHSSPYPSESLDGGNTVSHVFTVSNLMAGSHKIETLPPGVDSRTIEVTAAPPSEAGMGLFMVGGLAIGAFLMSKKKSLQ